MTLLERCYRALQAAGLDARLANAPTAACAANYCAIYEGVTESAGRTICYKHMMVTALVPHDQPAKLPGLTAEVRAAMTGAGLALYAQGQTQTYDDYKAIGATMDFRALCAK